MPIEIKTTIANQIRAYRMQHLNATQADIARHFDIRPVLVHNALVRGDKRRVKSLAH